jgi:hypothetical protein
MTQERFDPQIRVEDLDPAEIGRLIEALRRAIAAKGDQAT